MPQDTHWKQRFANYEKALNLLKEAVETYNADSLEIIKEGTMRRRLRHPLKSKLDEDISIHGILAGLKSGECEASFEKWLNLRK